ncbi:phage holin family protein [Changpingibacter yushuensis]|uniref:phage holin family protein n=1 Tax=Changpingibacter yushuensis TaxID=2758440 RepID=UPI0015F6A644|nr:phage holin family protein [Changpingibacter yushuensis]
MKFIVRAVVNAFALWVCVQFLTGVSLSASGTQTQLIIYYLIAGVIMAVINVLVRPIFVVLSIPLYIVTLGLFFIVINALMLLLTSWATSHLDIGIVVDSFGWAIIGGILIGIVNVVVDWILPENVRR